MLFLYASPRFPLKGSFKGDIDIDIGIGIGIDVDIDSSLAVSINSGGGPLKRSYRAPLKGLGVVMMQFFS